MKSRGKHAVKQIFGINDSLHISKIIAAHRFAYLFQRARNLCDNPRWIRMFSDWLSANNAFTGIV